MIVVPTSIKWQLPLIIDSDMSGSLRTWKNMTTSDAFKTFFFSDAGVFSTWNLAVVTMMEVK